MIKIALCDSNKAALAQYKTWIEYWQKKSNLMCSIQVFQTDNQLLAHFIRVSDLDILILDPHVNQGGGMQTVKKLRGLNCYAEVIYLASSENYLLEAFDTDLLYYQKKNDVTSEVFGKVFMRAVQKTQSRQFTSNIFSARCGTIIQRIPYDRISHFEITNRVVTMHYGDHEVFSFYSTIAALEEQLNNRCFLRVHRSFVVNLLYIQSVDRGALLLLNGIQLPVGVTYSQLLSNALANCTPSPGNASYLFG